MSKWVSGPTSRRCVSECKTSSVSEAETFEASEDRSSVKGQVPGHRAQVTGHRSRAHAARVASRTLQRRLGSRGRRIFLENPGGPS